MIRKLGKKGLEWKRERLKRIKELEATGNYAVIKTLLYGHCKDCGRYKCLDLDHKEGRDVEDPHALTNLDPICRDCHQKRHLNMSEKKENNKSEKSKKANWQKDHQCKNCKRIISTLLCSHCGKVSV